MEGWISLHRQIIENWIWKSKEPYDKRSAWTYLLLIANNEKAKVPYEKIFIDVERGQTLTSIAKLADKWHWSRHKVSNFLDMLELDNMIIQVRDTKKTLISIVNYDDYQDSNKNKDILRDT